MHGKLFPLLLLATVFLVSCDAGLIGDLKDNRPPNTSMTVDTINLPDGQRLNSQIKISWWGDDPDGFVVGYEFHIGDNPSSASAEWIFTTRTDSTFILPISEGSIDADVRFTVRAIDNEDARDPTPPSLVFPIRNSAPSINFVSNETPPDTTYRVFSFGFIANDPDGFQNLNRIEIALNDTSAATDWIAFEPTINLLTFLTDDSGATPITQILTGRSAQNSGFRFESLRLNADNTFYIRSIDNAGSVSPVRSFEWYVKRQTSRVLFLNDYFGPNSAEVERLHRSLLAQNGITVADYFNISDGLATGGRRVALTRAFPNRNLAAPTINLMLAQWDYIYWVSDDLDRNIGYAIELTIDFFARGGRMFVNIPSKNIAADTPVAEFLPIERVETLPAGQQSFIIRTNAVVTAADPSVQLPYLRFRRNLLGAYPLVPFSETVSIFEAPFETRNARGIISAFPGAQLISASSPSGNLLYFGIDITEFDPEPRLVGGNELPASNLSELIRITVIDILRFAQ
jgi:hypothetical protein